MFRDEALALLEALALSVGWKGLGFRALSCRCSGISGLGPIHPGCFVSYSVISWV